VPPPVGDSEWFAPALLWKPAAPKIYTPKVPKLENIIYITPGALRPKTLHTLGFKHLQNSCTQ